MDISKSICPNCDQPLTIRRMGCVPCGVGLEGEFEIPPLARLSAEDQLFVIAFVRHHGSIKKMESLFGISYPTVKNRLRSIRTVLDESFDAPSPDLEILDEIDRGEISVDEALRRLGG